MDTHDNQLCPRMDNWQQRGRNTPPTFWTQRTHYWAQKLQTMLLCETSRNSMWLAWRWRPLVLWTSCTHVFCAPPKQRQSRTTSESLPNGQTKHFRIWLSERTPIAFCLEPSSTGRSHGKVTAEVSSWSPISHRSKIYYVDTIQICAEFFIWKPFVHLSSATWKVPSEARFSRLPTINMVKAVESRYFVQRIEFLPELQIWKVKFLVDQSR